MTAVEVAAAAERSEQVRKALGDLGLWASQAYRDPNAALQRLEALEQAEGGPKGGGAGAGARRGGAADPAMAEAWAREALGRPGVEAELQGFPEAARQRLGEDGVRELVRGARGARDGLGQREGLAGIGRARPSGNGWGCGRGAGCGRDGVALTTRQCPFPVRNLTLFPLPA